MVDNNRLPLVTAACLCDRVLTERDGVMTLVRVVDQFIVGAPPDVVEKLNPHLSMTLVLMLKANGHTGKHQVTVQLHGPSKSAEPRNIEIEFPPDNPVGGANLVMEVAIGVVKNFGSGRFDVSYDGSFLTSVPFRLVQGPAGTQHADTQARQ